MILDCTRKDGEVGVEVEVEVDSLLFCAERI
jgi:hypothetical protein